MIQQRPIVKKLIFSILLPALVLLGNTLFAQDGKALFQSNCATCHNPFKDGTGPALKGVTERIPDTKRLHAWIHNSAAVLATGNKDFTDRFNQFNKTWMTGFGHRLSDAGVDATIKYVETVQPPTPGGGEPGGTGAPANQAPESDSTLLYGILTL